MISIDRLEEMAIEELQTELKKFEEQIKLQNNFIDSLLKATNNSEWLDKSMLDDEVSEVIEKIELDYEQLDQLKAENEELKKAYTRLNSLYNDNCNFTGKLEQTLTEIKELLLKTPTDSPMHCVNAKSVILQKIREVINE